MTNVSSFFIQNKGLFGGFPDNEEVLRLEEIGVRIFVDLTMYEEKKTVPYNTKYLKIKYPIKDRKIPTNWRTFAAFILKICNLFRTIPKQDIIYIHCRGGHGRSGVVVACILCKLFNYLPKEALSLTTSLHNNRKNMREKWRKIGSPQTRSQKAFVCQFSEELVFSRNFKRGRCVGFNLYSQHKVNIPLYGDFSSAIEAYNKILENQKSPIEDWVKIEIMSEIIYRKFLQNPLLMKILLNTGLKRIVFKNTDIFWGKNENIGQNNLGKILVLIRDRQFSKYFSDKEIFDEKLK